MQEQPQDPLLQPRKIGKWMEPDVFVGNGAEYSLAGLSQSELKLRRESTICRRRQKAEGTRTPAPGIKASSFFLVFATA
jgi:hypothetical protein